MLYSYESTYFFKHFIVAKSSIVMKKLLNKKQGKPIN